MTMTLTGVFFLLFVSGVLCARDCKQETGRVIWIRQTETSTFVNGCMTDVSVWDILSSYCDNGYKITHHAMSDNIKWYSNGIQYYSWTLVSDSTCYK